MALKFKPRKFFTGMILGFTLASSAWGAGNAKWEKLVLTENISAGLEELNNYCSLHGVTIDDVLWANKLPSKEELTPGTEIYLPKNHAEMLAIWQNVGAWKMPTDLAEAKAKKNNQPLPLDVPVKKRKTADELMPFPTSAPVAQVQKAPEKKEIQEIETEAPASNILPEAQEVTLTTMSEQEYLSELQSQYGDNKEPEAIAKARHSAEVIKRAVNIVAAEESDESVRERFTQLAQATKNPSPTPTPAQNISRQSPAQVINNSAKPDKILKAEAKKNKPGLPDLPDPIIILSPNGKNANGPMRLFISGDTIEVVRLPDSATPKTPSMSDLDRTLSTHVPTALDSLPYYNFTTSSRAKNNDFYLPSNLQNLNGKMLWPVDGQVSSYFGMRGSRKHQGIDIPMPEGTPIKAAKAGTVTRTGDNSTMGFRGYGNFVLLDHGGGVQTFYAHCSRVAVKEGQRILQGQVIGYVGHTGRSTANHLHFEVRVKDTKVDPMNYLANRPRLASKK